MSLTDEQSVEVTGSSAAIGPAAEPGIGDLDSSGGLVARVAAHVVRLSSPGAPALGPQGSMRLDGSPRRLVQLTPVTSRSTPRPALLRAVLHPWRSDEADICRNEPRRRRVLRVQGELLQSPRTRTQRRARPATGRFDYVRAIRLPDDDTAAACAATCIDSARTAVPTSIAGDIREGIEALRGP